MSNELTLSFLNIKNAFGKMIGLVGKKGLKEYSKTPNSDYTYKEIMLIITIPEELEVLINTKKINEEIVLFVLKTNFSMNKKFKIIEDYLKTRKKFDNDIEKLFLVMFNYDKKREQIKQREDREIKESNDRLLVWNKLVEKGNTGEEAYNIMIKNGYKVLK